MMTHRLTINAQTGEKTTELNVVAEVQESTNPNDYSLTKFQFEAALLKLGFSLDGIDRVIAGLQMLPDEKVLARSRIRNATNYHRDHPLFNTLKGPMGVTDEQIDAAWLWAKDQV